MRRRVCEATLDALCRIGYDRLSLKLVAKAAGVSQGAITHHFRSKSDLLIGAFEHMIAEWHEARLRFRAANPSISLEQFLRFLWDQVFKKPAYIAAIELMLAARADPDLQQRLRAILAGWLEVKDVLAEEIVGPSVAGIPRQEFIQLSSSLMRGLAVYASLSLDAELDQQLVDQWIELTKTLVNGPHKSARIDRNKRQL